MREVIVGFGGGVSEETGEKRMIGSGVRLAPSGSLRGKAISVIAGVECGKKTDVCYNASLPGCHASGNVFALCLGLSYPKMSLADHSSQPYRKKQVLAEPYAHRLYEKESATKI